MKIDEFCRRHNTSAVPIDYTLKKWKAEETERTIDSILFSGIITADGLVGDGLSDRVSTELRDALAG